MLGTLAIMHLNAGIAKVHNRGLFEWCSGDLLRRSLENSMQYAVWPWVSNVILKFPMTLEVLAVTVLFIEIPLSFLVLLGSPWHDFRTGQLGYVQRLWARLVFLLHLGGFLLLSSSETLYMHALLLLVVDPFASQVEFLAVSEPTIPLPEPSKSNHGKTVQERLMEDDNKWVASATKWLAGNTAWFENQLACMQRRTSKAEPGPEPDPSAPQEEMAVNHGDSNDDESTSPKGGTDKTSSILGWPFRSCQKNAPDQPDEVPESSWLGSGKSRGLDALKYPPGYAEQETTIGYMLDFIGWNPLAWDARARYQDCQTELEQLPVRDSELADEKHVESTDGGTDDSPRSGTENEELVEEDMLAYITELMPSKAQVSLGLMTFILLSSAFLWLLTGLVLPSVCKDPHFPFSSMSMYSVDPSFIVSSACDHPY